MTTTLTDRYVEATLRRLPARQRPDIDRELRASIADAIDDRAEAGSDPAQAEEAVLTELGDPARLAAGYADRPLHLVGPTLYLDYIRLLTALLVIVVPAVAASIGILRTMQGGEAWSGVGDTIGAAVMTTVHIAFWTTLVFAVIERTPSLRNTPARAWTPAALPEPPSRRSRFGELIAQTVLLAVLATFVLLSPYVSTHNDANGEPIGMLSPWLWDSGIVYLFLGLALAGLAFAFVKYYARWSVPVAIAAALVNLASAGALIGLVANNRLLNPAFIDAVGWTSPTVTRWIDLGLFIAAAIAAVLTLVETIGGFATRSWFTVRPRPFVDDLAGTVTRLKRR